MQWQLSNMHLPNLHLQLLQRPGWQEPEDEELKPSFGERIEQERVARSIKERTKKQDSDFEKEVAR